MKKNLIRSGNGWALFMPKTLLELLDINPDDDQVEIEIEGKVLKLTKAANPPVSSNSP